ncbi:hypothetical protein [Providencia alcalifaciens]|uniref:hypothetical protein n=1 Tax=Providencia alcalifaciens TaxID=126385 RepID=UPI001CC821E5|nr:hypothetical protein [Providencia alcalifaciens]CAG9430438.1 hypothetical protein NVI2019_GHJFPKLH_03175 [Providencia alcalifaciens]
MTRKPDFSKPVYGIQASINLLRKHYQDMIEMIGWMDKQRQYNFLKHSANQRFYAICSVDGLNSYISPEKIENQINYVKGGHGIRKVIKVLNRGHYIRIVENGSTIMSLGPDCIMVPK